MQNQQKSTLKRLLAVGSSDRSDALLRGVRVADSILAESGEDVSRAVLAQALNLTLFAELLTRVPSGKAYVAFRVSRGEQIVFDHGALRTVALSGMGGLPAGAQAITRILLPLGYRMTAVYPLDRLHMTGYSYTHVDLPEAIPQFFVSELHPDRFSARFQAAASRVTASSYDPLTGVSKRSLAELEERESLPFEKAKELLPTLLGCFQRLHSTPTLDDYQTLLDESAEMAWIATEGNVFNHATDRVHGLDQLVDEQRRLGRPLKETIEISRSGRVRQTAFRADPVPRDFIDANGFVVQRTVPGSFFEFIQRERVRDPVTQLMRLDLAFDSSNAQGIFKMTSSA